MFNFFVNEDCRCNNIYRISGNDFNHIRNVLRMSVGDTLLISENGLSNLCEITELYEDSVIVRIIEENYRDTELPIKLYLFQGLPKSDKLELIIQKTVELGVFSVIPVQMNRCVVKIEDKKKKNKTERWQAISESAAKQSKRNIIPEIHEPVSYREALKIASELDLVLLPYEAKNGMQDTIASLKKIKAGMSVGIFIGPEGGFDDSEIKLAYENNCDIISLGKRILRTETAAITAVSMCMLYTEINGD